jgi:predicted transcriptional regulator
MTKDPPHPTQSELEILSVLWDAGPSTVREVLQTLEARRPTGYTTVLKLLQIMTEKGLVRRDERERAHRYAPRLPRERTEQQIVGDLLDRAFGGSVLEESDAGGAGSNPRAVGRNRGGKAMTALALISGHSFRWAFTASRPSLLGESKRHSSHANPRARLEIPHFLLWPASCSTSFFQIFLVEALE